MSEVDSSSSSPEIQVTDACETGGALLRQARETAGYSVPALASMLKVSTAKLEALEANRWDLLPDIVFARALASSVCRALQIDARPVLARFPSLATPSMKTDESGINTPFRVPGEGRGLAFMSHLRQPGTLAVLALVFSAVALLFAPGDFLSSSLDTFRVAPADPTDETTETMPATTDTVVSTIADGSTDVLVPVSGSEVAVANSSPLTAAPSRVSASPLPLTVGGNGAVAGTVVLKATATSWVEVVDANGVVKVRKSMVEGEVLGASGDSPLSVVIGRADVVAVEVRGKSFDLAQLTNNNIARFEVK
ncbi:RodZ domain-containing protein [Rhodoferax sp. PAMC 29310]|uniref:helix-turn-helix domain-containing protein n=1 Tax=Rhodoferax sp. PAMC 29310 TaxID=2822760 RepID=UPI001B331656|nr:RodZ domain-containing protein [Rhodoferax sp. PAMC 29310]